MKHSQSQPPPTNAQMYQWLYFRLLKRSQKSLSHNHAHEIPSVKPYQQLPQPVN